MQTGYKYAYYNNYDIAIQFDADGQHNELDIEYFYLTDYLSETS